MEKKNKCSRVQRFIDYPEFPSTVPVGSQDYIKYCHRVKEILEGTSKSVEGTRNVTCNPPNRGTRSTEEDEQNTIKPGLRVLRDLSSGITGLYI